MKTRTLVVLLTAVFLSGSACHAQRASEAVAPLRANKFTDRLYLGFDRTRTDYALAKSNGNELATTNGVDAEYDWRTKEHLAYIGTLRYGAGNPFHQRLITGAAGASYLFHFLRYEPYAHAMGGYTRLASQHAAGDMYLSNVNSGFLMIFGAGLDVKLNDRWGVRAITLEDLYLPFGSARSTYWSVGSGVLYNLRRPR